MARKGPRMWRFARMDARVQILSPLAAWLVPGATFAAADDHVASLCTAIDRDDLDLLRSQLENNPKSIREDGLGSTLLAYAAGKGKIEAVKGLRAHRADSRPRAGPGTPLQTAVWDPHCDVAALL